MPGLHRLRNCPLLEKIAVLASLTNMHVIELNVVNPYSIVAAFVEINVDRMW
jgi:hypothetical protein